MHTRLFLIALFFAILPVEAASKKKSPTAASVSKDKPAAEAPPTASAWVRLWKGEFSSKRAAQVTFVPAAKGGAVVEFGAAEAVSQFGEYIAASAEAGEVKVFDSTDPKTPLVTAPVRFAPGACATLLVQEKGTDVSIEVLDDTPRGETTCELLVRNFVPTLRSFQVDAGPGIHISLQTSESFFHLRGLPRTSLQIETSSDDKKAGKIKWSTDIDFGTIRRATLLVLTDAYGRVRPRLVVDGVPPESPVPTSAQQR